MSKAVMLSIRPKWCELIASGEKTIEVRKTKLKLEMPFKCYIYCTRDKHLAFMQNATGTNLMACMDVKTAIPVGGFVGNGKVIGEFVCEQIKDYGIVRPETYGEYAGTGLSAAEMAAYSAGRPVYGWRISDLRIYDMPRELTAYGIKRPPQSFCYVEADEKDA